MASKARRGNSINTLKTLKSVTLLEDRAQLARPGRVEVTGKIYEASKIIIAVGASTNLPPVPCCFLGYYYWLSYSATLWL